MPAERVLVTHRAAGNIDFLIASKRIFRLVLEIQSIEAKASYGITRQVKDLAIP